MKNTLKLIKQHYSTFVVFGLIILAASLQSFGHLINIPVISNISLGTVTVFDFTMAIIVYIYSLIVLIYMNTDTSSEFHYKLERIVTIGGLAYSYGGPEDTDPLDLTPGNLTKVVIVMFIIATLLSLVGHRNIIMTIIRALEFGVSLIGK